MKIATIPSFAVLSVLLPCTSCFLFKPKAPNREEIMANVGAKGCKELEELNRTLRDATDAGRWTVAEKAAHRARLTAATCRHSPQGETTLASYEKAREDWRNAYQSWMEGFEEQLERLRGDPRYVEAREDYIVARDEFAAAQTNLEVAQEHLKYNGVEDQRKGSPVASRLPALQSASERAQKELHDAAERIFSLVDEYGLPQNEVERFDVFP